MSTAVTLPATHVMPNTDRSERAGVKMPQRTGYRTPQTRPARIQPPKDSAANMYGTRIARRRTIAASGPAAVSACPRGRAQREPHAIPSAISVPKPTTKNTISAREISTWNWTAV